jgi:outer membrane protein assembly factor BamA
MQFAFLAIFSVLLFDQSILAQSQQGQTHMHSPRDVSPDEFKELIGKKVYPKIIIDDVKFEGADLPDSKKENEVVEQLKQHEFDGGSDWLNVILEVPILDAWQESGFFNAQASGEFQVVSTGPEYEHVIITVQVKKGLRYRLGEVQFRESDSAFDPTAPLAFPREELRKQIQLQDGDIFDVSKIRESLDALKRLYGSRGYIDFVAAPATKVDDKARSIALTMELQEGKQFHVGRVEIFGLPPNATHELKMALKPGDVFNRTLADELVDKIMPLLPEGAARRVLGMRRDEKRGTVDLTIDFRPWPMQMEF